MALDPDQLNDELRTMCKGAGIWDPRLATRVGPQIRTWCGISSSDGLAAVRQKLVARVVPAARRLPMHTRLAVLVSLGIYRDAQQRTARQRVAWLAGRLERHERTIRRHIYEGIAELSRAASEHPDRGTGTSREAVGSPNAWYVQRCRGLMRLDSRTPELTEERTIVSLRDGLQRIILPFSLPRQDGDASPYRDIEVDILRGGRLQGTRRLAEPVFEFTIEFPGPLNTGEAHQYSIRFRLPEGQLMTPHYAFHPLRQCDSFDLTVRFHPDRLPYRVQRRDGVLARLLESWSDESELLPIDALGEVHTEFAHLHPGYAYGVSWMM